MCRDRVYLAFGVLIETPQVVLAIIALVKWDTYHDEGPAAFKPIPGVESPQPQPVVDIPSTPIPEQSLPSNPIATATPL